jgi:hypothetical protein
MQGFRRHRALAPLLAIAATALLALAGPAAANNGSHHDDDPAGTIASYDSDTNKLVIDLAGGGQIAGTVTRWTWIDADDDHGCDGGGGEESKAKRHGRKALHGDWCGRKRTGEGGGGHGWRHGPDGDESDLVEGAVVDDAILVLKDGRAFFAKVDLDD